MLYLHNAKYLEARELPAREPYPASAIVTLLIGTESVSLIGKRELLDELAEISPFSDVSFELRQKRVSLEALGASGKGQVFRLSLVRLLEASEEAA